MRIRDLLPHRRRVADFLFLAPQMTVSLDALEAAIQQAALSGFASVTVPGQTTTMYSLSELIAWRKEVERIQSQQNAAASPARGISFSRMTPGGCG